MERNTLLTIVVGGILVLMLTGCLGYPTEPQTSWRDDDYILFCEQRGGAKDCGYVKQKDLERELDFLRNMGRY